MGAIADRIGVLARLAGQLLGRGNELPRDRIGGIAGVDQRGDLRRHRDRIAGGDLLQQGEFGGPRQPAGDELVRIAQRGCKIDLLHASPDGGVHTTWSIRSAPLASITSPPSSTDNGVAPTAARKSSSSG